MAYTYTLQNLLNTSYSIIKQPENSPAYNTENLVIPMLNNAQSDIINWNIVNLQSWERLSKQALPFLNKSVYYNTHLNSSLTQILSVLDTTINVSSTVWFTTTGKLYIWWNIINYTWLTATQFTWITWIEFEFPAWTEVKQLYSLPTDFWQLTRITYNIRYRLVPIDQRDLQSINPTNYYQYSITRDDSIKFNNEYYYSIIDWIWFIVFVPSTQIYPIKFEYQKKATQFVVSNPTLQLLSIPDDYALSTIPYIAMSEVMANRWEMDEAIKLNSFGFNKIKSMYEFYSTQHKELIFNQRVKTQKDWLLNI